MPSLTSVVVPTRAAEIGQILRNLKLWAFPGFEPGTLANTPKPRLLFVFNNGDGRAHEQAINDAFAAGKLERFFSQVAVHCLDLQGLDDLYTKSRTGAAGPGGYCAGPNNQFFQTMQFCSTTDSAIFYMETDCIPVRRNWLDGLHSVAQRNDGTFVAGSIYRGSGPLVARNLRHLNGNAMYFVGAEGFTDFLSDLQAWLSRLLKRHSNSLAYDAVFEEVVHLATKDTGARQFLLNYAHRVQTGIFVQNICKPHEIFVQPPDLVAQLRDRHPDTYFLHGPMFSDAVDDMLAGPDDPDPDILTLRTVSAPAKRRAQAKSRLRNVKYNLIFGLRGAADWLETRNERQIFLPRFFRR